MLKMVRQRPWLIASGILAVLLFSLFVPYAYVRLAVGALLLLSAVFVGYTFRKHPSHSINRRQVLMLLAACAALFQMLRFLSGIYFGFYLNYPALSLYTFFFYILPYAAIIASSEYIRSALLGQNKRSLTLLAYLICLLGEVAMAGGFSLLGDMNHFLNVLVRTLFPALISNLVYHYLSRRYGMLPIAVYRLILFVIPACLPYAPAVPEALDAFASIMLPFAVWIFMSALYERKTTTATKRTSPWTYVGMGAATVSSSLIILLLTGHFHYGMIVIATPSMEGTLEVGDAVLFEAHDQDDHVEIGDIILFSTDGYTTVIHRVDDIQQIDGSLRYITKGDANEDVDFGYVTNEQITGRVLFRIPYLGQASLWFRGLFK